MTTPRIPITFAILSVAAITFACDRQVAPDYQGEALGRIGGEVSGEAPAHEGKPQVAVVWFSSTSDTECAGPAPSCTFGGGGAEDEVDWECIETCEQQGIECTTESLDAIVACYESCGAEASADLTWEVCATATVATKVPVTGQFPAQFDLELFTPPPAEALLTPPDGGPAVAIGWIAAVDDSLPESIALDEEAFWEAGAPGFIGIAEKQMLIYAESAVSADSSWGKVIGGAVEPGYHLLSVLGGECELDPVLNEKTCELSELVPSPGDLDADVTVTMGTFPQLDFPFPG